MKFYAIFTWILLISSTALATSEERLARKLEKSILERAPVEKIEKLLEKSKENEKFSVNGPNFQGETLLCIAINAESFESIETLIAHGADVNSPCRYIDQPDVVARTPLHAACDMHHKDQASARMVDLLLRNGAHPNPGKFGWTPAQFASATGKRKTLDLLVNSIEKNAENELVIAWQHLEIAKIIADPQVADANRKMTSPRIDRSSQKSDSSAETNRETDSLNTQSVNSAK